MRVVSNSVSNDIPPRNRNSGSNHHGSLDHMIIKCLLTTSDLRTPTPLRRPLGISGRRVEFLASIKGYILHSCRICKVASGRMAYCASMSQWFKVDDIGDEKWYSDIASLENLIFRGNNEEDWHFDGCWRNFNINPQKDVFAHWIDEIMRSNERWQKIMSSWQWLSWMEQTITWASPLHLKFSQIWIFMSPFTLAIYLFAHYFDKRPNTRYRISQNQIVNVHVIERRDIFKSTKLILTHTEKPFISRRQADIFSANYTSLLHQWQKSWKLTSWIRWKSMNKNEM